MKHSSHTAERPPTIDFAMSYASEEEGLVEDIVRHLKENNAKVFYDKFEKSFCVGKNLTRLSEKIYGPYSKFCVPLISKHYVKKPLPQREYTLALREEMKRTAEFILPIRIDDVRFKLLEEEKVYISLRKEGTLNTAEILLNKLRDSYPTTERVATRVWVATLGLNIHDMLDNFELPHNTPRDYVALCDWLEEDLLQRLSHSTIKDFRYSEASQRTGETLSVRIAFQWNPEQHALDFGDIEWWDVLQIAEFEKIYPNSDGNSFVRSR